MQEILSAALIFFLVMDPIGNTPFFLSALSEVAPERRRRVLLRELGISYLVLLTFLFAGQGLMDLLHIGQDSISIAGGVILFLIALRMIFSPKGNMFGDPVEGEPFVVPLAIPMLAGPSALATIMLLVRSDPDRMGDWWAAVTIAWVATAGILLASTLLLRLLKQRGLVAMEKLMGMLLVMLSVQMLLDGIKQFIATQ